MFAARDGEKTSTAQPRTLSDYRVGHDDDDDPVLLRADGNPVDTWREDYPYPQRLDRTVYDRDKRLLQIELLKLQNWVRASGERLVILFEGRDAAGKGGTIKRFMEHLKTTRSGPGWKPCGMCWTGSRTTTKILSRAAAALGSGLGSAPDPARKGLIIVMSDGQSERGQANQALAAVRALGVPIVAIAFGDGADPTQLREVADATGGTFVQQDDLVASLRQAAGYK